MDYKKKYKEALERVKNIRTGKCETTFVFTEGLFEHIFPELAESKDERIRRELIKETKGSEERLFETVTNEEFIAWLEKQGQVKESPISQHENKTCKENDDSLTSEDEKIRGAIIDHLKDNNLTEWAAWLEKQGEQVLDNSAKTCKDEQKTADKCEGCNNVKGCVACVDGSAWAHIDEQKPTTWSEEDDIKVDSINQVFDCATKHNIVSEDKCLYKLRDWLKSIKDRYTWKPSEEQIRALHDMNLTGNISYVGQSQTLIELYKDLKKLMEE